MPKNDGTIVIQLLFLSLLVLSHHVENETLSQPTHIAFIYSKRFAQLARLKISVLSRRCKQNYNYIL